MTGVISSWSRRRAAVAAENEAQEQAALDAQIAQEQEALAEKTDAEILHELGLPDPDAMVQGDDFKAFLSKTVPAHLRKRALRTLWRSNPVLACVDGLNDYDGDYLTGSTGQGAIKTSYQVGKGMLAHLLEMEKQNEAQSGSEVAVTDDQQEAVVLSAQADERVTDEAADAVNAPPAEIVEEPATMPLPRRMTFQFGDGTA